MTALKSIAAAALTLATSATLAAPAAYQAIPGKSPEPIREGAGLRGAQDLEAFFDGLMAAHLQYNPLAGATLAVVKDGAPILIKGYGHADLEKDVAVDGQTTLFRPGSTSKLFTWTAVMQLVEQGKLDLDADVNTYLADFKIPDTHPQPITLRNLMTHTAGLEDGGVGYLFVKDAEHLVPLGEALRDHIPARVRPPTTEFGADGTNASYSNWGTALAGHIVATVAGMPFDDYVDKHIFQPLGMTRSTFREPLPPELAPHMATGYTFEAGRLKPHGFEFVHGFGPAGSLTSSAADMAKFMIAHLNNGAGLLKPDTAALMHGRQFGANPHVNGSGLGFYETWVNGRRIIGHGGDMLAFHTDFLLLPEEKLGIFVSYNSSNELAPHIARRDLVRSFMDRYYPAKLPKVAPPADFAERGARYAGSYRSNRHSYSTWEKFFAMFGATKVGVTEQNTLLITDLGLPGASYWVEVAPHTFREVDGDDTIAFVVDGDGRATHLVDTFAFIGQTRLAWYETPAFHYLVMGLAAACFLLAVFSAIRHWRGDRAAAPAARRARRLAAVLGLIQLTAALILVVIFSGDIEEIFFALPPSLYVALTLPLLALPLTLAVLYFAFRAWKDGFWGPFARVQYSVFAVASAAFVWSLHYWNLLGYQIG